MSYVLHKTSLTGLVVGTHHHEYAFTITICSTIMSWMGTKMLGGEK